MVFLPTGGVLYAGRLSRLASVFLLVFLAACASNNKGTITQLSDQDGDGVRILLMPLDVELSLLTTGGFNEPNAEWTQDAKAHMMTAIDAINAEREIAMVIYDPEIGTQPGAHVALERLHGAVGNTILFHEYIGQPLPSKKDVWDWTLGPSVQVLGEHYEADYALFLFVRDSYASAGRVAAQVALAVIGVGISGGQQVGFASLVDLKTGEVGWFNLLQRGTGDLRTEARARETVDELLEGLPE